MRPNSMSMNCWTKRGFLGFLEQCVIYLKQIFQSIKKIYHFARETVRLGRMAKGGMIWGIIWAFCGT